MQLSRQTQDWKGRSCDLEKRPAQVLSSQCSSEMIREAEKNFVLTILFILLRLGD